jgi:hypothetical protein
MLESRHTCQLVLSIAFDFDHPGAARKLQVSLAIRIIWNAGRKDASKHEKA